MLDSWRWNNSNFHHYSTSRTVAPALVSSLHPLSAVCHRIPILVVVSLKDKSTLPPHTVDHTQRMARRAHQRLLTLMETVGHPPHPWLQAASRLILTHNC